MNKIESFQELLKLNKIDAYIIPTSDYHQSEYVSDYFKAREFLSGFTGSAGTLVITQDEARLWTDGRYFIQAKEQLTNTGIILMKMGQPNVPTILEYLDSILDSTSTLGFDSKVISTFDYLKYKNSLNCNINGSIDIVTDLWEKRPFLPNSMLYEISDFYSGESSLSKIKRLREILSEKKISHFILTSLEDQAWLYNLRADDVTHTPVFLAYTVISEDSITLFIDSSKLNNNVEDVLNKTGVKIKDYDEIFTYLKGLSYTSILIDPNKVNSRIYLSLNPALVICDKNPTELMKAIKNSTEIKNTKHAHELDGAAITKLMFYLKNNINKTKMTELSVQDYLEQLRRKNPSLIDLSFNTICGYKENAAMMHYSATSKTNKLLQPEGMILIDSGGHYLEGTTDITRTISLGNPTKEEKTYFTTVLSSVIDLASTVFLKGLSGTQLDIRAREPIWKMLLDYKCGTGHGVGHILAVHEGPNSFRYQAIDGKVGTPLVPGMITTDEPGIYLEGKFGIRTENELLCKEVTTNEWGTFYGFETITYAPIDLDLIDKELLNKDQIEWLNSYHKTVYEKISPYLDKNEQEWLKSYTKEI